MTKKRKSKIKNKSNFWKYLGKGLLFIIKIPYYFVKGIITISEKMSKKSKEDKIKKKRESIRGKYVCFKIIETLEGDYKNWFNKTIESDSQIGIIIGARGSGKTAFGVKLLENIYSKHKEKCFAIGFNPNEFPSWIKVVSDISELENDSWVLIDEGGILFSSRSSMSSANKLLSKLILIARHKNINILFISQNSSNLEVNILRQADFLALKTSSLLQKEFERKIIQKIYSKTQDKFEKYKEDKGLTYLYSGNFRGFVSNPLPSFWKESISKSFK
ncbi:MAG: hypothetical protein KKF48_01825 [Nanoarchaeota archaeon]|nr:hypothetical protein [Nanoarchaeota archaeon]MBU1027759.1 hypothetical protein [Nanoarchaeota archaeon]